VQQTTILGNAMGNKYFYDENRYNTFSHELTERYDGPVTLMPVIT
jgi:hypothetical protein